MLNRHKNWLVHKQTACGKDFSNPFMVDNLPKIVGFSTHLALLVKSWLVQDQTVLALASPKANELTIPEQTATGKGTSNPFMAGSLPKTTKPTCVPCKPSRDFTRPLGTPSGLKGLLPMLNAIVIPTKSYSLEEFAQILDIPCEGACLFTDKWSLDELAYGVPTDGPYPTNPPSPDDIISYIQIDQEGQVRHIRHEEEIDVHEHQILTCEIVPTLKPFGRNYPGKYLLSGGNRYHVPACLCYMLYCVANSKKFNLAYYMAKRMEWVTIQLRLILPYGMLLTRLFKFVMSGSSELSNESYVLYDRVMNPLTAHQERKTKKDHGTRRGRYSTSSSSAFDQPSSSHLNDDDDGNGEGTSRASTPSPIRFVNSQTNNVPQTPVESPILVSASSSVGSSSPVRSTTPPPDYPFDESIFAEMPPKRTSTSEASAMTQAAIRKLVADSVTVALEAQAATMANADDTNRNTR
ncbi:hypothetical protein Tco_1113904 [Tanacetum coccineum]|uniref:Uncharacterized protein n=1 Tax=Tanacetum coccineum TaxID=301880 RepID=A0ABQ5ITH8_9ASTR